MQNIGGIQVFIDHLTVFLRFYCGWLPVRWGWFSCLLTVKCLRFLQTWLR